MGKYTLDREINDFSFFFFFFFFFSHSHFLKFAVTKFFDEEYSTS